MFSIKLPETMLPLPEQNYHTGDTLCLTIKVIIDEPSLTGYNGLVFATEHIDLLVSPEASKSNAS
jgi:hypothetical protein